MIAKLLRHIYRPRYQWMLPSDLLYENKCFHDVLSPAADSNNWNIFGVVKTIDTQIRTCKIRDIHMIHSPIVERHRYACYSQTRVEWIKMISIASHCLMSVLSNRNTWLFFDKDSELLTIRPTPNLKGREWGL